MLRLQREARITSTAWPAFQPRRQLDVHAARVRSFIVQRRGPMHRRDIRDHRRPIPLTADYYC